MTKRNVERNWKILSDYLTGQHTLQELADRENLSRQRIHQLVNELDPNAHHIASDVRKQHRTRMKAAEKLCYTKSCMVCGDTFYHKRKKTCGPRCSALYKLISYHVNPDRRKQSRYLTSKWQLENGHVNQHALNVVNGIPITYKGRWVVEGSQTAKALEEANTLRTEKGLPPFMIG